MRRLRTVSIGWLVLTLALSAGWLSSVAAQGDGTDVPDEPAEAEETHQTAVDDAVLLSEQRVLSYYGFPGNELMGILGEYDMEELHDLLAEQAAAYEAADPSRPVKLAFEVIASVAQADAGDDGDFLVYTGDDVIQQYADYTAENDMLLFLDVQFGLSTVEEQIEAVRPWLELPHVHLALDPEFSVEPGEQPGVDLGSIDAAEVTYAQETLAELAQEAGIPPKILIVHQFHYTMITNKEQIAPVDGVQLVIDADGFGNPEEKIGAYDVVITQQPIEFHGIKLFYQQDVPLMTPEEIIALDPSPELVIYQ